MREFKKYFIVKASPEAVYKAITDASIIELWTDAPAIMEPKPGTEFSMYDGDISGKNIEFKENKLIIQEWYFNNPEGQESIVTIKLHEDKKGTSVEVVHTNIPEDAWDNMSEGWEFGYIDQIREILED